MCIMKTSGSSPRNLLRVKRGMVGGICYGSGLFKIAAVQRRLERNRDMEMRIKGIAAAVVLAMFLWGALCPIRKTMIIIWFISLPIIVGLFFVEVHFIKKSKEYEYEIYRLEVERIKLKKEVAKIKREVLTDNELELRMERPTRTIVLPISYYVVVLILDFLILMLILR